MKWKLGLYRGIYKYIYIYMKVAASALDSGVSHDHGSLSLEVRKKAVQHFKKDFETELRVPDENWLEVKNFANHCRERSTRTCWGCRLLHWGVDDFRPCLVGCEISETATRLPCR